LLTEQVLVLSVSEVLFGGLLIVTFTFPEVKGIRRWLKLETMETDGSETTATEELGDG
jgi:hypothetical protein